ncbi:hypothetical protein MRX96_039670 [Rhipicephalus microplus]
MAASAKTGYDPGTMQWVDIEVAETREDPIPGEDKYLQIMVRQLQEKLAKMKPRVSTAAAQPQARKSGSTLAACVESPRQLATWKPTNTPRIRTMNAGISVWPVWDQNIVVVGVKTESLASKLIGDITLTIGDHQGADMMCARNRRIRDVEGAVKITEKIEVGNACHNESYAADSNLEEQGGVRQSSDRSQ